MVKTVDDYLRKLKERYPQVEEKALRQVLEQGLREWQDLHRKDHDVRLENLHCRDSQYRLIAYRSKATDKDRQQRYYINLKRLNKLRDKKHKRYAEKLQSE